MVGRGIKAQRPHLKPWGRRASRRKNLARNRDERRLGYCCSRGQSVGEPKENANGEAWAGIDRADGQQRGVVYDGGTGRKAKVEAKV